MATKKVKVNEDKTVSFLTVGKPKNGTTIVDITGDPLRAMPAGKT